VRDRLGDTAAIVVLLSLAALVGGCGGGSSPGSVLERYFALSNQGRSNEAMDLVAEGSQGSLASSLLGDSLFGGLGLKYKGTTIIGTATQGSEATVHYRVRYSESLYDTEGTARLRKEDGHWLITSLY
jgi:hypothetical protein